MAQVQLLRNKNIFSSREEALNGLTKESKSLGDGSPLLARYNVSGNTRTVLGIFNNFSATTTTSLTTFDHAYTDDQINEIKSKPAYSATTEEFTFTLEDGTTVTKKICLL